ncbi:MAG: RNA polymerase sigma-70 factor [Chitinophagales bacterium]
MSKLTSQIELKNLFDKSYQYLVIKAVRIVYKQDVAEDLVQECFIKLWEKRETIDAKISIEVYLNKMIRNKCLDYLKKNKVRLEELDENIGLAADSDDKEEAQEIQRNIDKTLNSLPEKCRQVFVLSRFEEMSYKEISDQLDISKKTVEAHVSKALKSFRSSLKQYLIIIFKMTKGSIKKNRL